MPFDRTILPSVREDLASKMVFLAGPRQVGKTTLARQILAAWPGGGTYLSWDRREDRREILASRWPAGGLVVLDELHKMRQWKRWIKGEYDAAPPGVSFLVTGSARLDVYRRGGDSLQGRYRHWRLHPITLGELAGVPADSAPIPVRAPEPGEAREGLERLLAWSGFPEPLLACADRTWRRWQKDRIDRFFREDVRDLEAIRDLAGIQLLADVLPARIGSPLSMQSLHGDLDVSAKAVAHWVDVLDRLYFSFRIRPFHTKLVRGLRKMPKLYLWDATLVADPAARFENTVALHLLRLCHLLEDRDGYRVELCYLRDADGREVDFLVTVDRKPWFAVEAKLADTRVDRSLRYYRDRLAIPHVFQVVRDGAIDFWDDGIRVVSASRLLPSLG